MLHSRASPQRLGLITRTITNAGGSLIFWFVLQGCIALLYSLLGVLLFSQSSQGFGQDDTPGVLQAFTGFAFLSLAGMYDPTELDDIPGLNNLYPGLSFYITQIYFWSYMCISFFILFNALLAIIVSAYEEVREEMEAADKDPIIFAMWAFVGLSGIPGRVLSSAQLVKVLNAWVGHRLDAEIHSDDSLDAILERTTETPKPHSPDVHYILEANKMPPAGATNFLYAFRATRKDPLIALDRNLLALVARVYYAHYGKSRPPR